MLKSIIVWLVWGSQPIYRISIFNFDDKMHLHCTLGAIFTILQPKEKCSLPYVSIGLGGLWTIDLMLFLKLILKSNDTFHMK